MSMDEGRGECRVPFPFRPQPSPLRPLRQHLRVLEQPASRFFVPGDGSRRAEGGEGAGDALAGGADEGGDVALGEADIELDTFSVGLEGALRLAEAQEAVGDAASDVAGHQHFRLFVLIAQALGQQAQEGPGDGGLLVDRLAEGVAFEQQQLRGLQGADIGGARLAVEQAHFAEEVAGAFDV